MTIGTASYGLFVPMLRLIALLVMVVAAPAWAADPTTYSADGWLAQCDGRVCKASLASESRTEALLLGRWPGSRGVSIGLVTPRGIADRERPIDLRMDANAAMTLRPGHDYAPLERVETFWVIDDHLASEIVQGALKARHLRLSYLDMIGAPHDADFDVSGLQKVLEFIGSQPAAMPTQGAAPPHDVAPAPDLSRIELIIRMGLPDRLLVRHARASDCEDPASPRLKSVLTLIGPLSKNAILYAIPCSASGADISYRLWVIETGEIGGITPLYFALYDPVFGWKGSDLLYNVSFEPNGSKLTSTLKGQSGTCGHSALWHWKGYAFALDSYQLPSVCPGARTIKIYPPN